MLTAKQQRQLYDRLVEKSGKAVADAFLQAVQSRATSVSVRELADAIERGDLATVERLLDFERGALFPFTEALRSAYVEGALSAGRMVAGAFAFDGRNPRAEAFMARQGGELVTRISAEQRALIRTALQQRIETGESGAKTALRLVGKVNRATGQREGGIIGLTEPQAQWARNAEIELQELDANYFTRKGRDKRLDPMIRRAMKDGKPLAQADIDRAVGKYKATLLRQRGELIARTESHKATSAGQWEAFSQLVEQGATVTKRWVRSFSREPRLDHAALSLAPSRPLNVPFVTADGVQMRYPHDETAPPSEVLNCRCSVYYRVTDVGPRNG